MAKKDKKNKKGGITYESQQAALESIDKLVFGGDDSSLQIDVSERDDIADMNEREFSNSIDSLIRQRRKDRQEAAEETKEPEPIEETKQKIDVSDIIGADDGSDDHEMESYFNELNERLESESSEDESDDEESGDNQSNDSAFREIKISVMFTDVYKIVKFDDGIRCTTIDLNTLTADEIELPNTDVLNPHFIATMQLEEVLSNFYPSMLMSSDRFNSHMRHVSKFENSQFKFCEFDDEDANNNLIAGYYISEESLNLYDQLTADLYLNGYLASFLKVLFDSTSYEGFSFRMIPNSHIRQIMLTEDMEANSEEFMSMMINDDTIEIDEDHFNETAGEVVNILSFDFLNEVLKDILRSNSEEDEDESSEVVEEEEVVPTEVVPENHSEEEEEAAEEAINENAAVEEESESLFDDVEGAEDGAEEEEDPEELERQYYASKGKKVPQDKPAPKKKSDDDDDSKWVIKRR